MVRILKRTTRLLENTEKEAQEWTESKTPKQTTGSNPTQSTPPCYSPPGTRTARDQNKADAANVAKILKSAAKLIVNLGPTGREKRETKVDKVTGMDIGTKKPPKNENASS